MSLIEKLSIQGIRSFGPQEEDQQTIKFFTPLTLIVGKNGCGKTTIIECLRNAATGDFPSGKGHSFIHDPKLAHEATVRASVRLRLHDVSGKQQTVTRLYALTLQGRAKNPTFKSLDSSVKDLDGNQMMSQRCADFNLLVPLLLGVSKPILENVIFCHQSDSDWPLGENTQVKKRFDDIFAASKYVRALKEIRDQRKEIEGQHKILMGQKVYVDGNRVKAQKLRDQIAMNSAKLTNYQAEIDDYAQIIKPKTEELDSLRSQINSASEVALSYKEIKGKLEFTKGQREDIQKKCTRIMDATLEDIEKEKRNFSVVQDERNKREKRLEEEIETIQKRVDEKLSQQKNLHSHIVLLEKEVKDQEQRIRRLDTFSAELNRKFILNVALTETPYLSKAIPALIDKMTTSVEQSRRSMNSRREELEEQETILRRKIDEVIAIKARLEQCIHTDTKQLDANKVRMREIKGELQAAETYSSQMLEIESDIENVKRELDAMGDALAMEETRREVAKLKREKQGNDTILERLQNESREAQKLVKEQSEHDKLCRDLSEKEAQFAQGRTRLEAKFHEVEEEFPESNFSEQIRRLVSGAEQLVDSLTAQNKKFSDKLSSNKTRQELMRKTISDLEEERKGIKSKIRQMCDGSLDETLSVLEDDIREYSQSRGTFQGAMHMFKVYARRVQEKKCCPLCERSFNADEELERLEKKLNDSMKQLPRQMEEQERKLVELEGRKTELLPLRRDEERLKEIETIELPGKREALGKLVAEEENISVELSANQEVLDAKKNELVTLRGAQSEAALLDQNQREVDRLKSSIASKAVQLGLGGRSLDDVSRDQDKLMAENKAMESKLSSLQVKLERWTQLRNDMNETERRKLTLENKMKSEASFRDELKKLEAENVRLTQEIQNARTQNIKEASNETLVRKEREKFTREKDAILDKLKTDLESKISQLDDLKTSLKEVEQFVESRREEKLGERREGLVALRQEEDTLKSQFKSTESTLRRLRDEIASSATRRRELDDNIQLHTLAAAITALEAEAVEVEERLRALNVDKLRRKYENLKRELENLEKDKNIAEGLISELKLNIEREKRELNTEFKDAEELWKDHVCQRAVKRRLMIELDQCYKVLSKAIMEFHRQKMADINRNIRELWQSIYRGDDIQSIEIQFENEDAAEVSTSRQKISYCVMMTRNGVQQEMRTKCSAGQRVLACLVIRLALAEAFCANCGMLALDEPTTNLDHDNVSSLCDALARIVEMRRAEKNFQMIVITHDEDFIRGLGQKLDNVDYYYRVSKNDEGHSRITRCILNEIL